VLLLLLRQALHTASANLAQSRVCDFARKPPASQCRAADANRGGWLDANDTSNTPVPFMTLSATPIIQYSNTVIVEGDAKPQH
jgi:hypothetical protein